MPKRMSLEEFLERFEKNKYKELSVDASTYVGFNKKCKFIDSDYGEWWAVPNNIINKHCKHFKRYLKETKVPKISIMEIKDRIKKVWGNILYIDETTYIGQSKDGQKSKFIDKDFGEFYSALGHVLDGHGHPKRGAQKAIKARILKIEEVEKRLKEVHGDSIVIVPDTYISFYRKAKFIHKKYGEWEATPNNVISRRSSHPDGAISRSKKTFIENYGVSNPLKNKRIFDKMQDSCWRSIKIPHWNTGELLVCRGSYEFAIVNALNERKINFVWQIKFILTNNDVYFCDLYLVDDNKYVEIKGIFKSVKNKDKWDTFHSMFKNSELWQMNEVKQFSNKSIYKIKKEFNEVLKIKYGSS